MTVPQPTDHLRAQLSPRQGVDGGVDGFVRDPQGRRIGMHTRQYVRNLLGSVVILERALHARPQRRTRLQAECNPRRALIRMSAVLGEDTAGATGRRPRPRRPWGLIQPLRLSSRVRVETERRKRTAIWLGLLPCSRRVWITARSSRLRCVYDFLTQHFSRLNVALGS